MHSNVYLLESTIEKLVKKTPQFQSSVEEFENFRTNSSRFGHISRNQSFCSESERGREVNGSRQTSNFRVHCNDFEVTERERTQLNVREFESSLCINQLWQME